MDKDWAKLRRSAVRVPLSFATQWASAQERITALFSQGSLRVQSLTLELLDLCVSLDAVNLADGSRWHLVVVLGGISGGGRGGAASQAQAEAHVLLLHAQRGAVAAEELARWMRVGDTSSPAAVALTEWLQWLRDHLVLSTHAALVEMHADALRWQWSHRALSTSVSASGAGVFPRTLLGSFRLTAAND